MTDYPVKRRKKLIEVAIPLEAINNEAARRKRKAPGGFPTSFHKWWAQRPSSAALAILAAQLIDDPGAIPEEFSTQQEQEEERERLFGLISKACLWENCQNELVLNSVKTEIRKTWNRFLGDNVGVFDGNETLPPFIDPFSGGGIIPLEAQRLGLFAHAHDLNPIPVLIGKGLVELPALLDSPYLLNLCQKITGNHLSNSRPLILAETIQHYGDELFKRVRERLESIYPNLHVTEELVKSQPDLEALSGSTCTPAAWIWSRTVPSPNPAFQGQAVPLMTSCVLSSQAGKKTWVEFEVSGSTYSPVIKRCTPPSHASKGTKVGRGANFKCILSGDLITPEYIKQCSKSGDLGYLLIATVVDTPLGRAFMPPSEEQLRALSAIEIPRTSQELAISGTSQYMGVMVYGLESFSQLFTKRQAHSLAVIHEEINNIYHDVLGDLKELVTRQKTPKVVDEEGIALIKQLSLSVITYLAIASNRVLQHNSTACTWRIKDSAIRQAFPKQALQMSWDFSEGNVLGKSSAGLARCIKVVVDAIRMLPSEGKGLAMQGDARLLANKTQKEKYIVSTDPPYYDNVPYSDLADYFYLWTRSCLSKKMPELFPTLACPKADELVAFSYRHEGSKAKAAEYFLDGMREALAQIRDASHAAYPITIYYAFKQSESSEEEGFSSTGWETFLEAVISSGLSISTTWPLRTEGDNRQRGVGSNALATSLVLVCSLKEEDAQVISKQELRRRLRTFLPKELATLESLNIPPVDVAQAAIGFGISVYSQAKAVLKQDDSQMSVREALSEINSALDEFLSSCDDEFDSDTRFALTFFESYGYEQRPYGDAEGLAVARNVSVQGITQAGILSAISGKAQLLRREQLEEDWDPSNDNRLCVWEATQYLIKKLDSDGEAAAASLLSQLKNLSGRGEIAENCRALAYRLYNHCEKSKQTEEARAYNGLVIAWPELERLAASQASESAVQTSLI